MPAASSSGADPAVADRQGADGRIALTIGVTGHRDIALADYPLYRRRIGEFFDSLEAAYPDTPLNILSALAEGADRLPVEIALARGHAVFVPVPLPLADYERDFPESVAEFRALLAAIPAANVFELPALDAAGMAVAASADTSRDLHYAQAGAYIASHCHVLLALWDGTSNDLCGGTSEVVRYQLEGLRPLETPGLQILRLPDTGPVVQLTCRRRSTMPAGAMSSTQVPSTEMRSADIASTATPAPATLAATLGALTWHYPAGRGEPDFAYIYGSIDRFNGDPVRERALQRVQERDGHRLGPFAGLAPGLLQRHRNAIDVFSAADALAVHYQRISNRVLLMLVLMGGAMALFYDGFSHMPQKRLMLGGYVTAFILVCAVYFWQRRAGTHQRHLDFRALAEGMRVQLFWSLAGVGLSVAGSYLRKQNDELQWIREALRPVKVAARDATASPAFLYDAWIADQVGYFSRSAGRLHKSVRRLTMFALILFGIGLVRCVILFLTWDMLESAHLEHHWSIISFGAAPILAALIEAYSERMGNEARSKQHAILAGTFSRAALAFRQLQQRAPDDIAVLQPLLVELGREALIENGDWVLLRRERPMVLPKG